MKYIKKTKHEPKGLVNWRTLEEKADRINYVRMTGSAIWDIFPSKPDENRANSYSKKELWNDYLIKEQGMICAYCGRRIEIHQEGKSRIEHLEAKSEDEHKRKTLSYFNLVAVCQGDENPIYMHCDAKKGSLPITTFPTEKSCEEKFVYKWHGKIKAKDDTKLVEDDIETLGLNVVKLKIARNNVLIKVDTFIKILIKERSKEGVLIEIDKRIRYLQDRKKDMFEEFCYVEVYYLRKKRGDI